MLINDQAICIRTTDYSETSQIVTFFTRDHGKIGIIAKGSRRAKSSTGGALEVFAYGAVNYLESRQGGLNTLREFDVRHDVVAGMSRQMVAYYCGLLAVELLNKLTHEHDPHPELYDRFLAFIRHISGGDVTDACGSGTITRREALALLILFQQTLLAEVGLQLRLSSCVNCHDECTDFSAPAYFSSQASGFVCRDCEMSFPDRWPVIPKVRTCLQEVGTLVEATEATLDSTERLLLDHFTNLLHRRPKTAHYVLI